MDLGLHNPQAFTPYHLLFGYLILLGSLFYKVAILVLNLPVVWRVLVVYSPYSLLEKNSRTVDELAY